MSSNRPYSIDDLEDILKDIRNTIMRYRRHKHTYDRVQVLETREDLAILKFQLADLGSDLYGWKIESAAAYESARLRKEDEVEAYLNDKSKHTTKQTNVGDRAKRAGKMETSPDEMIKADKMNRLAINLYQYGIPDVLHAMASRLATFDRPPEATKPIASSSEEPADKWFHEEWDRDEKRVMDDIDSLKQEI